MMHALWLLAALAPLVVTGALATARFAPEQLTAAARVWLCHIAPATPLPAVALALAAPEGSRIELPWLLLGAAVEIDAVGRPLLLLTAAVYTAALVFVTALKHERAAALSGLLMLCYVGNAVVCVAADAATFYLGFTVVSFVGYALVVHNRTKVADRAGRIYLTITVLGESAVLAGILLVVSGGGLLLADAPAAVAASEHRDLIIALLLVGFGVKAGLVPLHVWLPLAHPAAPTPASAVLSGVMVKAGVLGWLRFLPLGEGAFAGWGTVVVLLAVLGAFLAVPAGVLQSDPKVILAYSTISQIGLLAVLIGVGLAEPALAPACILAAVLYAVHHGVAKAALFLGVPLWESHGAGRARYLVLAGLAATALAVAGAPLTSGYFGKESAKGAVEGATFPAAGGVELDAVLPYVGLGSTLLLVRTGWVLLRSTGEPARPGAGLGVWVLLIAAGFAGTAMLAGRWSPTLDPAPLVDAEGWWDQGWPILAGMILAGAGWWVATRERAPAWVAHPDGQAVPAGDVVVLPESLLRRAGPRVSGLQAALGRAAERFGGLLSRAPSPLPATRGGQASIDDWRGSGVVLLLLLAVVLAIAYGGPT